MADLIDRITGLNDTEKIAIHMLEAGITLYAFGEFTANQVINHFNLVGGEATQFSAVLAVLDSKTGTLNKMAYLAKVMAVTIAIESGVAAYWTSYPGTPDKTAIAAALEL